MLTLENHLTLDEKTIKSGNLTGKFTEQDLTTIGNFVFDGYDRDRHSRAAWERRTNAALDLALQVVRDKNFPWAGCSNVAFPLVTIAALQFHSRAYPALVNGPNIVKCRVVGDDVTGEQKARARRVSRHMSFQLLEQDRDWEPQHDALLINIPIVGTAFKKSYFSPRLGYNESEFVSARDLVIDYWAKSIEGAERKTHMVALHRNEIRERILRKIFRDVLGESWFTTMPSSTPSVQQAQVDRRQGVNPPQADETTPFQILEQHCALDLDNDGYAEPYIVTIEESSRAVLRIVTRFGREEDIERTSDGKIITIRPTEYFTQYSFIPSPDGGIYDLGFGVLLGPLNESVNSLINQLIDCGTMQTTAGGFLGRGVKIRGGVYTFAPFQWARVDSGGDDIKKNILPLPVNAPSDVLFQLLSLLINYANRIPGTTEVLVGESPGQNTPAETSRNLMEQGLKIYNAVFKRVWRSMKEEFKKLYILNSMNLGSRQDFGSDKDFIMREDYLADPNLIVPEADPNITSDAMQLYQAQALKQAAMSTPGYSLVEVEKNYLRALKVEGIDIVYPGPDKVPPLKNPKVQVEEIKLQGKQMDFQHEKALFAAELMETHRVNDAAIQKMEAEVAAILAGIGAEEAKAEVEKFKGVIEMAKSQNDMVMKQIDVILKGIDYETKTAEQAGMGGMAPASGGRDAKALGHSAA